MIVTVNDIANFLNDWAPQSLKMSYDNVGLQVGNKKQEVSGVLTTLDLTREVIEEAKKKDCNLIIAHHPIIFPSIQQINKGTPLGDLIIDLIKNDISLYVSHTNMDSVSDGVSFELGNTLGLKKMKFISRIESHEHELHFKFNSDAYDSVKKVLKSYQGKISFINEWNLDDQYGMIVFADHFTIDAIKKDLNTKSISFLDVPINRKAHVFGMGMIGDLPTSNGLSKEEFFKLVSTRLEIEHFRFSGHTKSIKRIAVCGGSGSFLIDKAKKLGADAYITADIKYHDYFKSSDNYLVLDIGHYESERFIKQAFQKKIQLEFSGIPVHVSELNTNPMNYYTLKKT